MKTKRNIFAVIIAVILLFIFIFSGYQVLSYFINSNKEQKVFDSLISEVENNSQTGTSNLEILPQYQSIYKKNPDLFGWIKINDTKINYPVMFTPDNEEFYLRKTFDKSYAISGTPFLAASCYENCGNYLIYGHQMKNGTMFGSLKKYKDKSYWENHKTINFDTLYQKGDYQVIAAFYAEIGGDFEYYRYTDLTDEQRFNEYINQVNSVKFYDTDIPVSFGDELLTLSTCSYHTDNGRFVVVARKCKL